MKEFDHQYFPPKKNTTEKALVNVCFIVWIYRHETRGLHSVLCTRTLTVDFVPKRKRLSCLDKIPPLAVNATFLNCKLTSHGLNAQCGSQKRSEFKTCILILKKQNLRLNNNFQTSCFYVRSPHNVRLFTFRREITLLLEEMLLKYIKLPLQQNKEEPPKVWFRGPLEATE